MSGLSTHVSRKIILAQGVELVSGSSKTEVTIRLGASDSCTSVISLRSKELSTKGRPVDVSQWVLKLPWHSFDPARPLSSSCLLQLLKNPSYIGETILTLESLPKHLCFLLDAEISATSIILKKCEFVSSRLVARADRAELTECVFKACDAEIHFKAGQFKAVKVSSRTNIRGSLGNSVLASDCELHGKAAELDMKDSTWSMLQSVAPAPAEIDAKTIAAFGRACSGLAFREGLVPEVFKRVYLAHAKAASKRFVAPSERSASIQRLDRGPDLCFPEASPRFLGDAHQISQALPITTHVNMESMKNLVEALRTHGDSDTPFAWTVFNILRWSSGIDLESYTEEFQSLVSKDVSADSDPQIYCKFDETQLRSFFEALEIREGSDDVLFAERIANLGAAIEWMRSEFYQRKGPPVSVSAIHYEMPLTMAILSQGDRQANGALVPEWPIPNWGDTKRKMNLSESALRQELESQMFSSSESDGQRLRWKVEEWPIRQVIFEITRKSPVMALDTMERIYNHIQPPNTPWISVRPGVDDETQVDLALSAMIRFFQGERGIKPMNFRRKTKLAGIERV